MPETILLRRVGALGDVLNTTPVARRLRQENADATIHVDTQHQHAYLGNPHINGFCDPTITYDRTIDLTLAYERDRGKNQAAAMLSAAFGDDGGERKIEFAYPKNLFPTLPERTAVLHPARSWPNRTLPLAFWQSLANELLAARFAVVVTGTDRDWTLEGVIDLRGKLVLAAQASLIAEASIFICSDSGLLTLAGATDTPTIALTTITPVEITAPMRPELIQMPARIECFGCSLDAPPGEMVECRRGDNACVETFDAHEIVDKALDCARVRAKPSLTFAPDTRIYTIHYQKHEATAWAHTKSFTVGLDDLVSGLPNKAAITAHSEMRCHYWVWKNDKAEWIGFQHYRRRFSAETHYRMLSEPHAQYLQISAAEFLGLGITPREWWVNHADIVVPRPLMLGGQTMDQHYKTMHRAEDWEIFADLMRQEGLETRLPYLTAFNMFIMTWNLFDEYMALWDRVMTEAERLIIPPTDPVQHRVFGFLSERLFTAWLFRTRCNFPLLRVVELPVWFCREWRGIGA